MTRRPKNALGAWRFDRLAAVKQSAQYTSLGPGPQQLVDYMVRRHDAMDGSGMYPSQGKTLAPKFGVTRETINRWLGEIVRAGVFEQPEKRYRGAGTGGGRSTNVYRVNPSLLQGIQTVDVTQPLTQPVTAEAHVRSHVEAPIGATRSSLTLAASNDEGASVRDLRPSSRTRLEDVDTGFAGTTEAVRTVARSPEWLERERREREQADFVRELMSDAPATRADIAALHSTLHAIHGDVRSIIDTRIDAELSDMLSEEES